MTVIILLLAGLGYGLLRSARMQTFLVQKITSYFSDKLGTVARIDGVDIELFSKVILEGVYIEDLHHDTLLYTKKLAVNIWSLHLKKNFINLKSISIENAKIGLVQYKGENDLNFQFIIDAFDSGDTTSASPKKVFRLFSDELQLKSVAFSYHYEKDTSHFYGVNFDDISLKNVNGLFKGIKVIDDSITADIKALSFVEKSGFAIKSMSTPFIISSSGMHCDSLNLITNLSKIHSKLRFKTSSYRDYNDFEEKVMMYGDFKNTLLDFGDISYFTKELKGIKKHIVFDGKIKGTVSNIKGTDMDIKFGKISHLVGNVKMQGLPDFDVTNIQLKLKEFTTNVTDLEGIPIPPFNEVGHIELPGNFSKLGVIKFKGDFTGFPNDFVAYGDVETDLGRISLDMDLKKNKNELPRYHGNLKSYNFNLGKFYAIENILTTLSVDIDIDGKGMENKNVNVAVNGKINDLSSFNYIYKNIDVEGNFAKNIFDGKLLINDENLKLAYDGSIDFTKKLPVFNFKTNVEHANLTKINLIKSTFDRDLSFIADVNFSGDDIDNIIGTINLNKIEYKDSIHEIRYSGINLTSQITNNNKIIQLSSDAANASIEGHFSILDLGNSFKNLINFYLPNAAFDKKVIKQEQDFKFEITTKNSESLSKILVPDLEIRKNTTVRGIYSSTKKLFELKAHAPELLFMNKLVTNLNINSDNKSGMLALNLTADNIAIDDSNKVSAIIIKGAAANDTINYKLDFLNQGVVDNSANIGGDIVFEPGQNIDIYFKNSTITVDDSLWRFDDKNHVHFDSTSVTFNYFKLNHEEQFLEIKNELMANNQNQISVHLSNFQLSNINSLIKSQGIQLGGLLNGSASFYKVNQNYVFTTSLGFQEFKFNNEILGNGNLISLWNTNNKSISLNGNFMRGTLPTLSFSGFYYPYNTTNNFDIEIQLRKTQLKLFEKFLVGVMSNIGGYISGDLFLQGSLKKPVITGDLEVQRGAFKVDYLNTSYTFNGGVKFFENDIVFNQIVLFDQNGKEANISGNIPHEYFKDIRLNVTLNAKKLFVLNTTLAQNSMYYGKAYTTGIIRFRGDLKKIIIDVDARTESGTQFNIPVGNQENINENKFVRFITKDSTSVKVKEKYKVDLSGIEMNLDLEVTPDAEVLLIFDSKIGDVISGTGSGNMKLQISSLGDFSMYGNYTIYKGTYLFTLKNVINKRFKISEGGTISWSGDPLAADINLEAIYKLRTSLKDVLTSDSSKQRVLVDCVLKMSDKLLNPTIKFDIKLPQSDEKIQNDLRSAINLDNEAELNKQMFSLLMLGRFFPTNDAGSSGSSALAQNGSELLSSQLSNWLSQSNEYVTLGLNYRAGDEVTAREVQVAMSTQLFKERLTIDGNLNVANNSSNASNLVGDVNIEYKITADGRFRIRAFNQSNDYTKLTTTAPYTQGIGFFYKRDFDTFGELINNYNKQFKILKSKKEKEEIKSEPVE